MVTDMDPGVEREEIGSPRTEPRGITVLRDGEVEEKQRLGREAGEVAGKLRRSCFP